MARFAEAAVIGGARGIRAEGAANIAAIRKTVNVPIVGISKVRQDDGEILITPTFASARELVKAGADMVALDCTARGQRYGALDRLRQMRKQLGVPVLADIATVEEAVQAMEAGADAVLSTLRGYTSDTRHVEGFEPLFIAELVQRVNGPVIAEGQIQTAEEIRAALDAGAFAVIVGTAISRPEVITQRFVAVVQEWHRERDSQRTVVGIDMGGTNTKCGVVSIQGKMLHESVAATPWKSGRASLLRHLEQCVAGAIEKAHAQGLEPSAIGLATAGWVDPNSGEVVYATENLPGWTGANPGKHLEKIFGLPVAVENDANALALAEKHFGAAKDATDFVCITLGTGVGGGCYTGGKLNRGRHFMGNALGHIPIVPNGLPCSCGQSGCLEVYANSAALLRYAEGGNFASCEQVIAAANSGHKVARAAVAELARYLGIGGVSIINLLDPQLIVLAGGLSENNPLLVKALVEELEKRVMVWADRHVDVRVSALGYSAGVLGAAAAALSIIQRGAVGNSVSSVAADKAITAH